MQLGRVEAVIVVNRRARHLADERAPLLLACRSRGTRHAGGALGVVETRTLEDLAEAARAIAARDDGAAVVLAGGDGSHMAGVSALVHAFGDRALPPIALAPGGTVNTVAKGWGLSGDRARWTKRLLDGIASGTAVSTRRSTLRVRESARVEGAEQPPSTSRVGFIVGAGLVARFFELYDARGKDGLVTAGKLVARIFAGSFVGGALARRVLEPSSCALAVDGAPAAFDRVSLVCASVVPDLGLGLRLLYRAGTSEERFHVVATPLGPARLGPQLPLVLAGRPLAGPRVDTLARTLSMRFPDGTGAYVLDGELYRADAVDVTPGPVLEVLTPP